MKWKKQAEVIIVSIFLIVFWGWIPILALGKAISWCIEAAKTRVINNYESKEDNE